MQNWICKDRGVFCCDLVTLFGVRAWLGNCAWRGSRCPVELAGLTPSYEDRSVPLAPARAALTADELLGVVCFLYRDNAGVAAAQLPLRRHAVRATELTARQCAVDEVAYVTLPFRVGNEQRSDVYLVANPVGATVVGCHRARRFVIPMTAQGYRDRCPRSLQVRLRSHAQNRVVSECLAHRNSVLRILASVTAPVAIPERHATMSPLTGADRGGPDHSTSWATLTVRSCSFASSESHIRTIPALTGPNTISCASASPVDSNRPASSIAAPIGAVASPGRSSSTAAVAWDVATPPPDRDWEPYRTLSECRVARGCVRSEPATAGLKRPSPVI